MIRVPGGTLRNTIGTFGTMGPFTINDYFIDRYEVTNREFKQFVDRGGYRSREYWKEPFRKGNRTLTWDEAMSEFHDSTGQPGPATWELGTYLEGKDDFPVSGVSWYEASAYEEFAQKKLPTVAHWFQAAQVGGRPYITPASNFSNKGPARVGQYGGISGSGAYDMAGNVREWCSNASEDGLRFALGGAPGVILLISSQTRTPAQPSIGRWATDSAARAISRRPMPMSPGLCTGSFVTIRERSRLVMSYSPPIRASMHLSPPI